VTLALQEVTAARAAALPDSVTPLGSAYTLVIKGPSGAPAEVSIADMQWTLTYSDAEVAAAGMTARRNDLVLYLLDAGATGWVAIPGARSVSANGRTSVFATFTAKTGCVVQTGLPPASASDAAATISAERLGVSRGTSTTLTCSAVDTQALGLTYAWTADVGTLAGDGSEVTWTAPDAMKVATVSCVVTDGLGSKRTAVINLASVGDTGPPTAVTRGVCVICFDDANLGDWRYAFPYMLENYGMKGVCYLQSNRMGTGVASSNEQYMVMQAAGWEIGNHTQTGQLLSTPGLTPQQIMDQLVLPAQDDIQAALGGSYRCATFAAPQGNFGAEDASEEANVAALLGEFDAVRGTNSTYYAFPIQNLTTTHANPGAPTKWVGSWSVQSADPQTTTFAKHLVDLAADNNGCAILHFHNITEDPTYYDVKPAVFSEVIDHVAASGVDVVTMDELFSIPWPTNSAVVADGGFTRMAALWGSIGQAWPVTGQASLWDFYYPFRPSGTTGILIDAATGHDAAGSARLDASASGVRYLEQRLSLEPNTDYVASAWVKTQNLVGKGAQIAQVGAAGAKLLAPVLDASGAGLYGTNDWTYVEGSFTSGPVGTALGNAELWLQVEGSSGTAWFDDVSIEPAP
jgi:peptidoglycan/xylan/chitin deacetylase (PgdA/CDA1 family)